MSTLFSPLALGPLSAGSLTLENRIVIPPMCQYSAHDGLAQDWHLMHYGSLAMSGAGLLIMEATAVEPCGRISAADLGLWDDATEAALGRVLAAIRAHSPIPLAVQLAHAGRKASCALPWMGGLFVPPAAGGWLPCAPSPRPYAPGDQAPSALDAAGVARVRQAFAASARRAARLGFDAVELHAAHGYLLHEFLSPLTNQRTDEYGGSLENRMRLVLEIFTAMRAELPEGVALGVRISATDWAAGGWDVAQSVELAKRLKGLGAAYIHVSSGGLVPEQKITLGPGYQVPFAEAVRRESGLATIAVGLITEPKQAEEIVSSGQADAVALGRAMLYDPRWPWHAAAELGAQASCPPQYLRCQPRGLKELLRPGGRR
jgi:2,4-dienoyl-CoA reductase-like NADH-dependent reductase (Old Yellow Enzyme family)